MEAVWTEPGSGFSDDWLGFHRSTEKKASGRFYAQCKYCAVVMDGRLPNLRKHKLICAELASAHDVDNVEYYETPEHDEGQEEDYEQVEEPPEEIIKSPKRKRKSKTNPLGSTPSKMNHHLMTSGLRHSPFTPAQPPVTAAVASPPAPVKTRFTDTARVWERKLCDLPLGIALQLEKNVNDMMFEATLANLQYQSPETTMVKVKVMTEDH